MRIAVLADTHIPKRARTLPEPAWKLIKSASVIVHAGDVLSREFLEELSAMAPLYAVRGNNDLDLDDLPETLQLKLAGSSIGVIHDSGDKNGRAARMRKRFPDADAVIFGHSHIPLNEIHEGQLLFNPGSATDRRMQPHCTMGIVTVERGRFSAEIVRLD